MTGHYFENPLVNLHYYRFGNGSQKMLCFHGYGMHGKQFKILANTPLASKYTFYGFDLFFHKETKLKDQSLETVKAGISKKAFADLIKQFCASERIDRFSVIGYSMGSHYATVVVEELGTMVDEYIVLSPASLKPGPLVTFFAKNKAGNTLLQKLALSQNGLMNMLKWSRRFGFLDEVGFGILKKEIETEELRFNFYACFTYLRFFETDEDQLVQMLNQHNIKSIFIFGKRDKMYPPRIGKKLIARLPKPEVIVLDETHEMINVNFVTALSAALL
ncbi:MAG: alpha/beta hydrolase [Bacteroidetes bacterium]|nr:alpha/beta hydrolase [Bacteroidota bacterium]